MTVDRLIAFLILQLFRDIGRKRHFADLVQSGEKVFITVKVHDSVSVVPDLCNRGCQDPVSERKARAFTSFSAGFAQCFPAVAADLPQQKKFYTRSCSVFYPIDPGRQNPGIVGDDQITFIQIINDIIKMPVFYSTVGAVQYEHPRTVARLYGRLRYQFLGKVIIKVACFHGDSSQSK